MKHSAADTQVGVAILRVEESDTREGLLKRLPLNLHPLWITYCHDSAADSAERAKTRLAVEHLVRYDLKGSLYSQAGTPLNNAVAKSDPFLEHILVGVTFPLASAQEISKLLLDSQKTPVSVFLHDCLEEVYEATLKSPKTAEFEVVKSAEDKERANQLKTDVKNSAKFYNRLDGNSTLSGCSVLMVTILSEDKLESVQETTFQLRTSPETATPQFDFAGYFQIDGFFQSPTQNLGKLFSHVLERASTSAQQLPFLIGGDDLSCHLYAANASAGSEDAKSRFTSEILFSFFRNLYHPEKPRNVHLQLVGKPPIEGGQVFSVRGDYIYYHYLHDGFNDAGWGCAYRSLQTLFSWFLCQGYTQKTVPSIVDIQNNLVLMKDKPPKFLGSTEWIGSFEVSYVLNRMLGVDSKIINVGSGAQVTSKLDEFKNHFEVYGTPIMIGGGVLAYTMLGVNIHPEKPEESQFLILDPHFKAQDDPKLLTDAKKGGVWWRGNKLFDPAAFYNFCCPIPIKS